MWSPWKGQHSLNLHDAAALEFTSKVVLVSVGPRWRLQGQVKERKICHAVIGNCKRQAKGSREDKGGAQMNTNSVCKQYHHAREIAQPVKCSPHKQEDLSSMPSTPAWWCTLVILALGICRSLGFTCQSAKLNQGISGQAGEISSKSKTLTS